MTLVETLTSIYYSVYNQCVCFDWSSSGLNTCAGKLTCNDGRCLSHKLCCREKELNPPNCTIMATIQCCRQLVHPGKWLISLEALKETTIFIFLRSARPNQYKRYPFVDYSVIWIKYLHPYMSNKFANRLSVIWSIKHCCLDSPLGPRPVLHGLQAVPPPTQESTAGLHFGHG